MNDKKPFWIDAAKRVGTWLGSSAGVAAVAWVSQRIDLWEQDGHPGHLVIGVILIAVLRAVLALIQGNVGDGTKASFTRSRAEDVPDDAS